MSRLIYYFAFMLHIIQLHYNNCLMFHVKLLPLHEDGTLYIALYFPTFFILHKTNYYLAKGPTCDIVGLCLFFLNTQKGSTMKMWEF